MTYEEKQLEKWFEQYVPDMGIAETVGGELVRAVERLAYRYYNDGDKIGHGYGIQTVNSSYRYLCDIIEDFPRPSGFEDDEYEDFVHDACASVVEFLEENPEYFEDPNSFDSRKMTDEDRRDMRDWEVNNEDEYDDYDNEDDEYDDTDY